MKRTSRIFNSNGFGMADDHAESRRIGDRRRLWGFTIVETMVALVIIGILARGFLSVFLSSRYLIVRSKMRSTATEVARRVIESQRQDLVRDDFWDTDPNILPHTWSAPVPVVVDGISYNVSHRIDNVMAGATVMGCRKMTVRVVWDATPNF